MNDSFRAQLQRLESWLNVHRPEYWQTLQPGVAESDLKAFEEQFGLSLPVPFRELYRWRNGQSPLTWDSLRGNRSFCSLETIAETKAMLDGMIGTDFDDPEYWQSGWVPFLHNGGGSYLCVDLSEEATPPGRLIAFWKADHDRPVEYAGLEDWLNDLVDAAESGELEAW